MKIRLTPHTLQRAFVLLLFSLVAGISSVFAQDNYTYLQFSGNGRTVLLAKDGALTVVSTTEDARLRRRRIPIPLLRMAASNVMTLSMAARGPLA